MAMDLNSWTIAGLILGLLVLLPSIMGFFSSNKFNVAGKTVLLTGASEGMGKEVAIKLSKKGASIIIVSRTVTKLESALSEIKAAAADPSSQRFHYISADLSSQDAPARVITEATAWNNGQSLDVVWCIAGSSYPFYFIDTPLSKMREQMNVNFWSCAEMAHAVLPSWLSPSAVAEKDKVRHLIFTSSVVAFYPIVGYTPYAPGKAAIRALSDSLAQEVLLYGDNVKIHTVFPGTIYSPGLENENKTKPAITHILEEADTKQTPEKAASEAIAGLEKGEYLVVVSWLGSLMRGCAWGGSTRSNWLADTSMTWLASLAWMFVGRDMDGKVVSYRKKNGHPSGYVKV